MKILLSIALFIACLFLLYYCINSVIEIIKAIKDKKSKKKGGEE